MRTQLAISIDSFLERYFPERRVFLRSDKDTRFIRLRPLVQLFAFSGAALVVAWSIIATAILLMDSIGAGNFREQAKRDQQTYQSRLNFISVQRDTRAEEALAAQERFNSALQQISLMQSELLASETRRREMETGIEIIQNTLRSAMNERDDARDQLAAIAQAQENGGAVQVAGINSNSNALGLITQALAETAAERDKVVADAQFALNQAAEMEERIALMKDQNDQIFRQLEEAMTVSVKPLDRMFRAAGMNTDILFKQVRRGYDGQGGALTPLSFSTRGEEPSSAERRANRIIRELDRLNLYRLAASKAPFANPVKAGYRFTSPYGYRRYPKTGGRRIHNGVDFA